MYFTKRRNNYKHGNLVPESSVLKIIDFLIITINFQLTFNVDVVNLTNIKLISLDTSLSN